MRLRKRGAFSLGGGGVILGGSAPGRKAVIGQTTVVGLRGSGGEIGDRYPGRHRPRQSGRRPHAPDR